MVKPDELPNPENAGFFGTVTVVLEMDTRPDEFQQYELFRYCHVSTFLPAIYDPLCRIREMMNQSLEWVQTVIYDTFLLGYTPKVRYISKLYL